MKQDDDESYDSFEDDDDSFDSYDDSQDSSEDDDDDALEGRAAAAARGKRPPPPARKMVIVFVVVVVVVIALVVVAFAVSIRSSIHAVRYVGLHFLPAAFVLKNKLPLPWRVRAASFRLNPQHCTEHKPTNHKAPAPTF